MKCNHSHFHANAIDPTKTSQLRKRFEADFKRRYRKVMRKIVREVVELDGFGLSIRVNAKRFDFPTNQAKVAGFMTWLNSTLNAELFGSTLALPRDVAANKAWMNTYIQTSYRRGMARASTDIRRAGGRVSTDYVDNAFFRPIHADRVGIVYTRAYDGLRDITTAMDEQISTVLAEGLADGRGVREIAKAINNRVEKIGLTRSRLLARTEVIAAHAESKLNVYEDANIQGVGLQSEWLTAGDDRVCPECDAAAAQSPYTVNEAHGMIPLHPNCRCTWVPVITDGKGIELS